MKTEKAEEIDDYTHRFVELLDQWMTFKNVSRYRVAKATGVNESYFYRVIAKKTSASKELIAAVSKYADLNLQYIMWGKRDASVSMVAEPPGEYNAAKENAQLKAKLRDTEKKLKAYQEIVKIAAPLVDEKSVANGAKHRRKSSK